MKPLGANNVLLQAGPVPGLGDVATNSLLPAYREVGQRLKSLRLPAHVLEDLPIDGMTLEEQLPWLDRFF